MWNIFANHGLHQGSALKVFYERGSDPATLGKYSPLRHTIYIYHDRVGGKIATGFRCGMNCILCRRCFVDDTDIVVSILNHELYHAINRPNRRKIYSMFFLSTFPIYVSSLILAKHVVTRFISVIIDEFLVMVWMLSSKICELNDESMAVAFALKQGAKLNKKVWVIAESNREFLNPRWMPTDADVIRAKRRKKQIPRRDAVTARIGKYIKKS